MFISSRVKRIDVIEIGNTIEMIYIETENCPLFGALPERKIFKIVYSCIDGKWNKSDRIYGKIIPAINESYIF